MNLYFFEFAQQAFERYLSYFAYSIDQMYNHVKGKRGKIEPEKGEN